jgi:hypothetical protein
MNQIDIDTFFGDKSVHLQVKRAFAGTFQVWINENYQGLIMQSSDGCSIHFNQTTVLQSDDIAVIIEMIEENSCRGLSRWLNRVQSFYFILLLTGDKETHSGIMNRVVCRPINTFRYKTIVGYGANLWSPLLIKSNVPPN